VGPLVTPGSTGRYEGGDVRKMKRFRDRIRGQVSCQPRLTRRVMHGAAMALALISAASATAQELTPRAYWPAPKGTRVMTVGMSYVDGDLVPDPSLPFTGLDSTISTFVLGYLQTIDLFGRSANVVFEAPFSDGTTTAVIPEMGTLERSYRGVGDVAATLSINLSGAPSMSREDFAALRQNPRPILGASIKVVAPTGDYDSDRVINVGANRWAARAELGYINALTPRLLLEVKAGAWVFDDNDDFLGQRRSQAPIYSLQANLIRRFAPGFWLSLDASAYRGGRSEIGDVLLNDLQRDSRIGASLVFPVLKRNALRISLVRGSLNDSDESFNIVSVALQHFL
jgi:hypothetical protein